MQLKELRAENFGKFHGESFSLEPGMNIVWGGNESGKTTIRALVLFVLFGERAFVGAKEGSLAVYRSSGKDVLEGSILLEYMGKEYLIRRAEGSGRRIFSINDVLSGRNMSGERGDITSLIPGLSPDRFANAISLPRAYEPVDDEEYDRISRERDALQSRIDVLKAGGLDTESPEYKEKLRAASLIEKNNEIADRYSASKRELEELRNGRASGKNVRNAWNRYEDKREEVADILYDRQELLNSAQGGAVKALVFSLPIAAIGGFAWLFGGGVGLGRTLRDILGVSFLVLAFLVFLMVLASGSGKKRRARRLGKKVALVEKEMQGILSGLGISSRDQLKAMLAGQSSEREAQLLREMKELKSRYDELQVPLRPYLEKYGDSISIGQPDREDVRQLAEMEKKRDELSARMEELGPGGDGRGAQDEPVPLVLDSYFDSYDDGRLKRTFKWLTGQDIFPQALILTCHKRERELLDELSVKYTYHELV